MIFDPPVQYDYGGSSYIILAGTVVIVAANGAPIPDAIEERAVDAEYVYVGKEGTGDVAVVVVVGEIGIRVTLTQLEARFFYGMIAGTAD